MLLASQPPALCQRRQHCIGQGNCQKLQGNSGQALFLASLKTCNYCKPSESTLILILCSAWEEKSKIYFAKEKVLPHTFVLMTHAMALGVWFLLNICGELTEPMNLLLLKNTNPPHWGKLHDPSDISQQDC